MSIYDFGAHDQDDGRSLADLIEGWNNTFRAYPSQSTLRLLCEDQVQRSPEAAAVTFEGCSLSYRELSSQSNQLAHLLRQHGVGPDVLVGVTMERSLELVVALLGVLKAGGAYVAMDPDYPPDRLAQIIADAKMPVILTQKAVLKRHADLLANQSRESPSCATLCLDTDGLDLLAAEPTTVPDDSLTRTDLAYVIYTSGTTGRPKGVLNTHRGICNRLQWMQDEYQIGSTDSVLQKTPTSFDVSVWEFFWPLITGARLVLARPGGQLDSNYLCDLIDQEQITVMHFVPSMLRVFLQEPRLDRCRSLRHVICSGEELSVDLQNRVFERLPTTKLHNLYGPTEAAIDVTSWECRRDEVRKTIPIGRPVANTQIHILDPQLQPVGIGESGELHIGGVQVARGYLNRTELTGEKFIDDPFRDDPAAKLYKTGDLARFLPDGNIEFLGRADHQVKIRGQRIELKEIELVLQSHSNVQRAVVVAHEFGPDDLRLVAYILAGQPTPANEGMIGDLRNLIKQRLPEYMTPSLFLFVDQIPLTPSGKLDRDALPPPTRSRPPQNQPYVAPRTPLEHRLVDMWREILQLDEIGVDDPFFELGGDSLRAAEFVNRLQQHLQQFIYVVTLFQSPSVAKYAEFLQRDYASAVASWLGQNHVASAELPAIRDDQRGHRRVDETMLQRMQSIVPSVADLPAAAATSPDKNPPAIFILAPPRSGTTLLRIMLAGHPQLFAAAELQLLGFQTLQQRKEAFSGKFSPWLDGTIRAIMQLKQCPADEAKSVMASMELQNDSTKDAYRTLQQWAGVRKLVDKSPSYAVDPATLKKAECDFDNAFYIHLVRHPYAMVRSFERQHMEQILYLHEHDFTARELGELVWTLSHRNVLDFLQQVPRHRQSRICFEQLVQQPQQVMTELCAALDIDFHASLLTPYQDQHDKMVDGVYDQSTPMGDTNFFNHKRINPNVASQSELTHTDDFLGDVTWAVAQALGYFRPEPGATDAPVQWQTRRASARARRSQKSQQRRRRSRPDDE